MRTKRPKCRRRTPPVPVTGGVPVPGLALPLDLIDVLAQEPGVLVTSLSPLLEFGEFNHAALITRIRGCRATKGLCLKSFWR